MISPDLSYRLDNLKHTFSKKELAKFGAGLGLLAGACLFLASTPTAVLAKFPPESTPTVTPTEIPVLSPLTPEQFAEKALGPQSFVGSDNSHIFTSTCFGPNANPLQDRDYMTQNDGGSKCQFGYDISPQTWLPQKRYKIANIDGQMRFYIVPPDAFTNQPAGTKVLSGFHLIVPTNQGCASLGSIGFTADGKDYQTDACAFRPGIKMKSTDGAKVIPFPQSPLATFDPEQNGGSYGFVGFPAVLFKDGFSLYYTGQNGYPPPRIYFEADVDTLSVDTNVKATAEMTNAELQQMADAWDHHLRQTDPKTTVITAGKKADQISSQPVIGKSKDKVNLYFSAPPDSYLAGITWHLVPLNNRDPDKKSFYNFLETNLQLRINSGDGHEIDEETTGVEDTARCAFYNPCQTGWSGLFPTGDMGYTVVRNFPFPLKLTNGKIDMSAQIPDNGTTIEMSGNVTYVKTEKFNGY